MALSLAVKAFLAAKGERPLSELQAYLTKGGDPNLCFGDTLLHCAIRRGHTPLALQLLKGGASPSLTKLDLNGYYPLHLAVATRVPETVVILMDWHLSQDRSFDPRRFQDRSGNTPLDAAKDNAIILQALQVPPMQDLAPPLGSPCHYDPSHSQDFVNSVAGSTFVEDHYAPFERAELPLADIVEGIVLEEQNFFRQHPQCAEWMGQRDKLMERRVSKGEVVTWRCHPSAQVMAERLQEVWDLGNRELFEEAVCIYTTESFLRHSIKGAVLTHDIAKHHLAPFIQLLHCALRFFSRVHQHSGLAYSYAMLDATQQSQFQPVAQGKDSSCNYLCFHGFMSACICPRRTATAFHTSNCNTLFIISPADKRNPNCCPVAVTSMSAYPKEHEALYPLGQHFTVISSQSLSWQDVCQMLGMGPLALSRAVEGPISVIELRAVDVFWELAGDIIQNGEAAEKLQLFMRRRLAADVQMYGLRHATVAAGLDTLGRQLYSMGQFQHALDKHTRALAIRLEVQGNYHPDVAATYSYMALAHASLQNYSEAIELLKECLNAILKGPDPNCFDVCAIYIQMASVYTSMENYIDALELYEKALAIETASLGKNHPKLATIYCGMAAMFSAMGDYRAALDLHEQALVIQLNAIGHTRSEAAKDHSCMAQLPALMDDFEKAVELYEESLIAQVNTTVNCQPRVAAAYHVMATGYYTMGQYAKSLQSHEKALQIRLETLGQHHPDVASTYSDMAAVYTAMGKLDRAVQYHEKSISIMVKVFGLTHPSVVAAQTERHKLDSPRPVEATPHVHGPTDECLDPAAQGCDCNGSFTEIIFTPHPAIVITKPTIRRNATSTAKAVGSPNLTPEPWDRGQPVTDFSIIDAGPMECPKDVCHGVDPQEPERSPSTKTKMLKTNVGKRLMVTKVADGTNGVVRRRRSIPLNNVATKQMAAAPNPVQVPKLQRVMLPLKKPKSPQSPAKICPNYSTPNLPPQRPNSPSALGVRPYSPPPPPPQRPNSPQSGVLDIPIQKQTGERHNSVRPPSDAPKSVACTPAPAFRTLPMSTERCSKVTSPPLSTTKVSVMKKLLDPGKATKVVAQPPLSSRSVASSSRTSQMTSRVAMSCNGYTPRTTKSNVQVLVTLPSMQEQPVAPPSHLHTPSPAHSRSAGQTPCAPKLTGIRTQGPQLQTSKRFNIPISKPLTPRGGDTILAPSKKHANQNSRSPRHAVSSVINGKQAIEAFFKSKTFVEPSKRL